MIVWFKGRECCFANMIGIPKTVRSSQVCVLWCRQIVFFDSDGAWISVFMRKGNVFVSNNMMPPHSHPTKSDMHWRTKGSVFVSYWIVIMWGSKCAQKHEVFIYSSICRAVISVIWIQLRKKRKEKEIQWGIVQHSLREKFIFHVYAGDKCQWQV